ncbi:MAG: hypothetical protein M1531_05915 [Chloroflexi bacterium]|nr:hypothetical protein [Chloroflexota bacterium]
MIGRGELPVPLRVFLQGRLGVFRARPPLELGEIGAQPAQDEGASDIDALV